MRNIFALGLFAFGIYWIWQYQIKKDAAIQAELEAYSPQQVRHRDVQAAVDQALGRNREGGRIIVKQ